MTLKPRDAHKIFRNFRNSDEQIATVGMKEEEVSTEESLKKLEACVGKRPLRFNSDIRKLVSEFKS